MTRTLWGLLAAGCVLSVMMTFAADESEKKSRREELEQAFATKLTGASMKGSFSVDGRENSPNKPDSYRLVSAKKMRGDDWVITSKMKVGESELDIPIPIKIYWADDTPVMSLTDLTIPGVGTFTARVMFYGNRYAGTWQHGEVGGHMWGIIEPATAKQ